MCYVSDGVVSFIMSLWSEASRSVLVYMSHFGCYETTTDHIELTLMSVLFENTDIL